jgi:hypothetical protein
LRPAFLVGAFHAVFRLHLRGPSQGDFARLSQSQSVFANYTKISHRLFLF